MLILVLLLVAAARAEAAERPTSLAPEGERPAHALWTLPITHGSLLLMGPFAGALHLALPVGTNLQLSDRSDLVIEVTPMYTRRRCSEDVGRCGTVRALKAYTGVAWTPWPGARGDGFFIQPKLGGMWSHAQDRPEGETVGPATRSTTGGQLTFGLDLGYRKTAPRSRSFLAAVIGAGVGYSWNQRREEVDLGAQYGISWGDAKRNGRIVDINMDILRFGFTF